MLLKETPVLIVPVDMTATGSPWSILHWTWAVVAPN